MGFFLLVQGVGMGGSTGASITPDGLDFCAADNRPYYAAADNRPHYAVGEQ